MRFDTGSPLRPIRCPGEARRPLARMALTLPVLARMTLAGMTLPVLARMALARMALTLPVLALFAACQADAPASLKVVTDAPAYPAQPTSSTLTTDSPISAMAGYDGDVLVGTDDGVYHLFDGHLEPVEVIGADGEPATTGGVLAMYHRTDGVIIAAENGFFTTYEWVLTPSPITEALAGLEVTALDSTGRDADQVTWVAAVQGLFRLTPDSLEAITLPGVSGAATAVGALDGLVLAAFGSSLYEISPADWSVRPAPDVGLVRRMAVSGDTAWLTTDHGLVKRDPQGVYTLFTLSGTSSGQPVHDLALDVDQNPVLVADSGVVRLNGQDPQGIVATQGAGRKLALDAFGDVWMGDGSSLIRFAVGQPVSFAGQVSPIFGDRCNVCHLDGAVAPRHDFTDYGQVMAMSESILSRVLSGQMPPTGPLPEDEYQVIVLWDKSGLNP